MQTVICAEEIDAVHVTDLFMLSVWSTIVYFRFKNISMQLWLTNFSIIYNACLTCRSHVYAEVLVNSL